MGGLHLRTIAIVQARMGSTRLPGKVLEDIAGMPMVVRVARRVRRAASVDRVVVATTLEPEDNAVAEACESHRLEYFRGDARDVLSRFVKAARAFRAQVIVRVTGDCPLIDPGLVDLTVAAMQRAGARFAANRLPSSRTYPIGLDVEVCTIEALEEAGRKARSPEQREHVMPYFYQDKPVEEIVLIRNDEDLSWLRWTVDEPSDLELIRAIYAAFEGSDNFGWEDVLRLVRSEPRLQQINAGVRHRGLEASG